MARKLDINMLRSLTNRHGRVYPEGSTVFQEGERRGEFYVILQGAVEIVKDLPDDAGNIRPKVLATLGPGEFFGEMAAFTGEPRSASAVAAQDTTVLYFDQQTAIALLKVQPQFGLDVIRTLCERIKQANEQIVAATVNAPADAAAAQARRDDDGSEERSPSVERHFPAGPHNEEQFTTKVFDCPICRASFATLSVRSQAIKSSTEDSDGHRSYEGPNPLHYTIPVCPSCLFAAYPDDFKGLRPDEVEMVRSQLLSAERQGNENFCGERSIEVAARTFMLALQSYSCRRTKESRWAQLYHQVAWVERERGNRTREREFLAKALGSYRAYVDQDRTLSGPTQVRMLYLIGELSLRLGQEQEALRWFQQAAQHPDFKKQPLLPKLLNFRLEVAREAAAKKGRA